MTGVFTDMTQDVLSMKNVAETYMQMYQYAAEDFTSIADMTAFIELQVAWAAAVNIQLSAMMTLIATHTHNAIPHFHISSAPGNPTSPEVIPFMSLPPDTAAGMVWAPVEYPLYVNTTLTPPNLTGNYVAPSIASEGSLVPKLRRFLPIPITETPSVTPSLVAALTPSIGG